MKTKITIACFCSVAVALHPATALEQLVTSESDSRISEALKASKFTLDARYRFESKDQEGFAGDAQANTLRTRLGFETGEFHQFKFLVEVENVTTIGDDHFNSTTNGRGQFPVIADPDTTEINRAQITYTGIPDTTIVAGRQRYNLANQRFVGAVGFRQNEQTFDAARIATSFIDNLTVDYLYIDRVHRIFGDDNPLGEFDSDSHVISAAYDAKEYGKFTGYGVLLDFDEAPALSSSTWGLRYEKKTKPTDVSNVSFGVIAEFAVQTDRANNPFDYRETYVHGEAQVVAWPVTAKVGYERLGGDGTIGFSTPLATQHKFQGFADVFLTTPVNGIADVYGSVSYQWNDPPVGKSAKIFATYHDFNADRGGMDFGEEFDAGASLRINDHWSAELKGASYSGNGGFADRNILWLSLRFQL